MSLDARWLRRMTAEVARAPMPDLDWDQIEQRVFERIDSEPAVIRLHRSPPAWRRVAGLAAVAAAIAVGVFANGSRDSALAPSPAGEQASNLVRASERPASAQGLDSASIPVGSTLVADGRDVVVHQDGWATWRVSNGSRVRILSEGDTVALDLLEGRIEASVVPQDRVDAFTIRVGGTRVSVHGTIFAVERAGERVLVTVQRGTVAVGAASRGHATQGWLVVAPGHGSFSLDGARTATIGRGVTEPIALAAPQADRASHPDTDTAEAPLAVEQVGSGHDLAGPPKRVELPEPSRPVAVGANTEPAASAGRPETLTALSAGAALGALATQIEGCYRRNTPPETGEVTLHAHTVVHLTIAPDGHVQSAFFDPPLAPAAQTCASGATVAVPFPRARVESKLQLPLSF